ncbi:antitoxin [Streptomyces heilongjiangensis]|uniref:Antitoxin n=1 Tax=Streptomyces heilongjiangensis TaxID=945052 RepID=A0ABW1BCP0_9ACTN|nr:antitoxin [Streptomyces heilongjiangensis]MDC2948976.1 antitoxin [Streptomyces heilongjiangensis]
MIRAGRWTTGLPHSTRAGLSPAEKKVSDLARKHEGRIQHGLDTAAHAVDRRTTGTYRRTIQSGPGKSKLAMDRLAHGEGRGGTPPPAS